MSSQFGHKLRITERNYGFFHLHHFVALIGWGNWGIVLMHKRDEEVTP